MKKLKNISLILLVLVLLIIGSSSIVVTNENEYSLIRQFGKVDHVVSSAASEVLLSEEAEAVPVKDSKG